MEEPLELHSRELSTLVLLARSECENAISFGIGEFRNGNFEQELRVSATLTRNWTLHRLSFLGTTTIFDARVFFECAARESIFELAFLGITNQLNSSLEQEILELLEGGFPTGGSLRIRLTSQDRWQPGDPVATETPPLWQDILYDLGSEYPIDRRFRIILGHADYRAELLPIVSKPIALPFHRLFLRDGNLAKVVSSPLQPGVARVEIQESPSQDPGTLALVARFSDVKAGERYAISFHARADEPRKISFVVQLDQKPWNIVGENAYRSIALSKKWREFYFEFVSEITTPKARVSFQLGGNRTSVELAKVNFLHVCDEVSSVTPEQT
ncbi:MAG: carbohydrate binding domain-containing protein [Planctomycetota bacterium]